MNENKDALGENEAVNANGLAGAPDGSVQTDGAAAADGQKCGDYCMIPSTYVAEHCFKSAPITIDFCSDYKEQDIGDVYLESLGRLLNISLTLKHICPCKEVAVGLLLTELDFCGREHKRGFKTVRYPGHINGCHDVKLTGIRWALPEFYDETGSSCSLCNPRKFVVRATANYVNTNVPLC